MNYATDFAVAAQGAAAAAFREGTAIRPTRGPVSTAKEIFAKNVSFLKLLRTFVTSYTSYCFNLANEVKQKNKLATYECWYRKGHEHFVSEVCRTTLRVAFLLIKCKIR